MLILIDEEDVIDTAILGDLDNGLHFIKTHGGRQYIVKIEP